MAFSLAWIPPQAQAQLGLGSLIVTMTSPASGSTVSGTVPVNASVSVIGSLTVSQVQFYSLDMYISGDGPQEAVFTLPGLAAGSHTPTSEVTGLKNPASAGTAIVMDAFDVTP